MAVLSMLALEGAQVAQSVPAHRVIINFLVPIDSNSINFLLRIVNEQMRAGNQKVTILISSPGGDTTSAYAAYNILRNMPAEITTFNVGNVDSAAMLLYCAGKYRYSLPGPGPRFLIHGNSVQTSIPMNGEALDAQLQQLRSLNQMVIQAIAAVADKAKRSEIESAVHSQSILSPEQAVAWGLVQELRKDFMEPGAILIAVDKTPSSVPPPEPSHRFSSITTSPESGR